MNCHYRYSVRSRNGDLTLLWRPGRDDAPDTFLVDAHARPLAFADERSLAAHCERHALVLVPGGEADLDLVAVREWVHRPQLDPAVAGLLLDAWNFFTDLADSIPPGSGPGLPEQGTVHRAAYAKLFEGSALDPAAGARAWSAEECRTVRDLLLAGLALWRSAVPATVPATVPGQAGVGPG